MRWLYIQDDTNGIIVTGITGICTNQFNLGQSSEAFEELPPLSVEQSDDEEEEAPLFDLSAGLVKNDPMPFCQSGVGRTTTGFPPPYFPLPAGELPSAPLELLPAPPKLLRGALAATTFLDEPPPQSALVLTIFTLRKDSTKL